MLVYHHSSWGFPCRPYLWHLIDTSVRIISKHRYCQLVVFFFFFYVYIKSRFKYPFSPRRLKSICKISSFNRSSITLLNISFESQPFEALGCFSMSEFVFKS